MPSLTGRQVNSSEPPHKTCGCSSKSAPATLRLAEDAVEATPQEIASVRSQLTIIEPLLNALFGETWSREPSSLAARRMAAELIEQHFDGIVAEWEQAVAQVFGTAGAEKRRENLHNSLVRFVAHLRDPDNLDTYINLRQHCQEGMLSRANPAQFNLVHIALKQKILRHVRSTLRGHKQELVRDAVVAAIDELRMMVSGFYIESREAALRASEEKYRNSIDHAPDPMYEIDPDTFAIITANSAALELTKATSSAENGAAAGGHALLNDSRMLCPGLLAHLKTVVEKGSAQGYDIQMAGRYFDVNSALIPFGKKRFIQMILHDVTEKREMLEELLKAERLAATGTFAAGVAHEVNNPLASISSLVQALSSGESDPARRTTVHTILAQITRISATLKDLVDFARPSTAERRPLNLNTLVTETLRLLSYNKRFSGVALEPRLAPDLNLVFADNNEIQQVLLNLMLNAADATQGSDGRIKIVTENHRGADQNDRVVMRIIDNGIGIPREHLDRVFEPFFTTKPAGAGAGLGLSLCQRIVLSNRGTIRIDSEVGKGTTIKFSLPAYEPSQDSRPQPAAR
jgi:signal transduction histidine kinase/PAS domain-containing protein